MRNTIMVVMLMMAAILFVTVEQASALAILKFEVPKPGVPVPAGQPLAVRGTSMQPNSTATNCNVQLQTNQNGYKPTTPTGPPGPNRYINWTAQSEPLKPGLNTIEAQLMCFPPSVNPATNNHSLLKHLVHNVTAGASAPAIGSQQPSSTAAPVPGIQPPLVTK